MAAGIGLALRASFELGMLRDPHWIGRCASLAQALGLPFDLADLRSTSGLALPADALLEGMRHDKKGAVGEPELVLVEEAGAVVAGVRVRALSLAKWMS